MTHDSLRYINILIYLLTYGRERAPAVNDDGSFVSKLFLGLMYLTDELDEPLAAVRHTLVWPVSKLKLSYCATLAVLYQHIMLCTSIWVAIAERPRCRVRYSFGQK